MTSPARILLFDEGATKSELRSHLVNEGFHVACARTFLEAAPLLAVGRVDLFLFYLPEEEWVRNAILTETRRANPKLPIVAMTSTVADDLVHLLARFHVSSVLPARGNWRSTIDNIRSALASADAAEVGTVE